MMNPIGWPEAQRICDIPEVREALDKFAADAHDENMLSMACAIMGHASAQERAAGLEEIIDMLDKFGTLKYRAGCSTVKTSQELLEQAHAYRHMIHEALAKLSPIPSVAGKDDARDAARYRWLRECGAEFNKLEILDICGYIDAEALDEAIDAAMSSLEVIGKGEKG